MKSNFLFVLMLAGALAACKKEKPKEEIVLNAKPTATERANAMPKMVVTNDKGEKIEMKDLKGRVLLVCYNPGCDHCQREAKQLSQNKDMIKDYQVYFLTPENITEAVKFSKDYNLTDANVHFVTTDVTSIFNALGPVNTVPTFFVYRDQNLVKRLEGEVAMSDLRSVLL